MSDSTPRTGWMATLPDPKSVKQTAVELYREFSKDNATTLAAAVAYHTIFAIPALLILIVMAAAELHRLTDVEVVENLRDVINEHAPESTLELLNEQVDQAIAQVGGGELSFGIIATAALALWSGSNAINSLITGFNQAYGVEESRPFVRKKVVVLGLTLYLAIFINMAFALLIFGERIGSWFADRVGAGSIFDTLWGIARFPAAIIAVGLFLAVLYYLGPNVEQSFRWISPGSALATILWLVATGGFGIYLQFFNPGSAYGVVGSALVLLFYLYVTGLIFIIGAELNAVLGKRHDPATVDDLAANLDAEAEEQERAQRQLMDAGD